MAEYSIHFGQKLFEAGRIVLEQGGDSVDTKRTVLYLSLLSCEIILKAFLERAGKPIKEIKARSHNLEGLLDDLGCCEVEEDIGNGILEWVPAVRLRSEVVKINTGESTVGKLLAGESQGASGYPNQIRYGDRLYHFPPEAVLNSAAVIHQWVQDRWNRIRLS